VALQLACGIALCAAFVDVAQVQAAPAQAAPVSLQMRDAKGQTRLDDWSDTADKISFIVEADNSVQVTVKPTNFAIRAGESYSINSSYFVPWIQQAERDGELVLNLESPRNSTIVIEKLRGAANLLVDGDFESGGGWNKEIETGAAVWDESFKRSGAKSLRLSKDVGAGSVAIRLTNGVAVQAGETYLLSGYYSAPAAQYGSLLTFLAQVEAPGKDTLYLRDNHLNPLIYTEKNEWKRAYFQLHVPSDYAGATVRVLLQLSGAPATIHWDDLQLRIAPSPALQKSKPLAPERVARLYPPAEIERLMKTRTPLSFAAPVPLARP
jgi:hypothetical protein